MKYTANTFKLGLAVVLLILSNKQLFGQTIVKGDRKKELIGTWEFLELRDKDNHKVDTIRHRQGYELAQGPTLLYRADGNYSKQFTPVNIDEGKWSFDAKKQAIIHLLYYKKPYSMAAQYLIDTGHAKKDNDGNYYEVITDKVITLTDDRLTILEREERKRTFRKVKQ